MAVWMATQELRGSSDSILEAGSLFLTCDYHLYVFDQRVLRKEHQLGSVVMPNHFLQMLRPLAPSTDDFDRRFVETFAIPEFRTIGSDYAATVSKVLSYLASFSNIREETAVRILADELLIERLKGVDEGSDEFKDSIESALAKENEELLEEVALWKSEAEQARREREEALAEIETKERELAAKAAELDRSGQAQQKLQEQIQITEESRERAIARWRIASGVLFGSTAKLAR